MSHEVDCCKHGKRPATLMCTHIAHAADTDNKVGFCYSGQDTQEFPDVWCSDCNSKLLKLNAWTKEMFEQASFKVLCSHCYIEIKEQQQS
ncbi:hypothetical protein [Arsukibacterium sp.]|uniref:hypothetical protein n=1 Tax=Arsukibacterium sp. TaxID=1977258 RepID=UPI00299D16F1|nr:hypothetical protein [Arsukibacterium sp.]MDX1538717.1 hypothetical protein [Arsukibacterium sp.]